MRRLKRSECCILPLVLKRKWDDMIDSGEKREEYRDFTFYWQRRLNNWVDRQNGVAVPVIEFRLGYASDAPRMAFLGNGPVGVNGFVVSYRLRAGAAFPQWGEPNVTHYVIPLGERIILED